MIYPNSFESKIGFDSIKRQVLSKCLTSGGRDFVENISFTNDYETVVRRVSETEEMRQILLFHTGFHFSGFPECIEQLKLAAADGNILDQQTMHDLRYQLNVFNESIAYFRNNVDKFPLLASLWSYDFDTSVVISLIDRIIDDKGEIRDSASEKLAEIRSMIVRENKRSEKQISAILRVAKQQGIVKEDSEISIRDGRAVIPIPAANKRMLRGFIHDSSSTGQTLYVEPNEIFEINNQIRELINDEKQEIVRILRDFTMQLKPDLPVIIKLNDYLAYIDFLRAKALYAIDIVGVKPVINNYPTINLIKAKHPTLLLNLQRQNRKVVPQNLKLDDKNRILVISGPNAGGKSITLKTVAISQYMIQCGLLISASENSELGIFDNIFIDIGDEQSIENDLSTYTSHLKNIRFFIENSNSSTLVLIDEIGSGTEPQLGGAIAEASLEKLCDMNVKGVVTTHYANIKRLASTTQGLFNGAMLFDKSEIKPLFQLSVGKPGSSYTFEIAKRVGFPSEILSQAAAKSEAMAHVNYEALLEEIEVEKQKIAKEKEELNVADEFLKEIIDKYTKQLQQIENSKKDIIKKAKAEAADIYRNANRKIEQAIKDIREAQAEKERTKVIRERLERELKELKDNEESENKNVKVTPSNDKIKIPNKIRKKLDEINKAKAKNDKTLSDLKIDEINKDKYINDNATKFEKLKNDFPEKGKLNAAQNKASRDNLKCGSFVTLEGGNSVGEIVEIKGKEAKVQFDNMAITLKLKDLVPCNASGISSNRIHQTSVNNYIRELNERAYNFSVNIDVRGMRADEAIYELEKYLDDVIMYGIRSFSILHGKGNGVLRKIIRDFLSRIPQVMFYGDESLQNGGDGVTVVSMGYEIDKIDDLNV